MRDDLSIFDDEVKRYVFSDENTIQQNNLSLIAEQEQLKDILVPVEVKITKSKETGKGNTRFVLFCKENTRIYNNVEEYLNDAPSMRKNSSEISKQIDAITSLSVSSVTTTDFDFDNIVNI